MSGFNRCTDVLELRALAKRLKLSSYRKGMNRLARIHRFPPKQYTLPNTWQYNLGTYFPLVFL